MYLARPISYRTQYQREMFTSSIFFIGGGVRYNIIIIKVYDIITLIEK